MRESEAPSGDMPIETESRRPTPSDGLGPDPADSSNEDFLFHLYRGSELLQDNRVHEAKEELERALHLQPRDSKGQDLLAVVYFRLGLYARAIQIYEQLRRHNASDTSLLLNLSLCYLKTGQPQAARRDLELLLSVNPTHTRAWGYLGLACERLGDLAAAERAFQQGGHGQMAKRLAARRDGGGMPEPGEPEPSHAVRAVAGAAYRDLDTGELSFALADPTSDRNVTEAAADSWRPLELGQLRPGEGPKEAQPPPPLERGPDTKDGPRMAIPDPSVAPIPSIPQLGIQQAQNRRPTLIAEVGVPPAHDRTAAEFSTRIPSHQPPSFTLDDAAASIRRPVVSVPSPFGASRPHDPVPQRRGDGARRGTLSPPHGAPGSPRAEARPAPQPYVPTGKANTQGPTTPLGMGPKVAHDDAPGSPRGEPGISYPETVRFPAASGVELHRSGLALVQATADIGFAARLESIRAQQSGLKLAQLERQVKGKPNGEGFGGVGSPMVLATGLGQLVLGPRLGRKLFLIAIESDMCFVREDVLLGFGAGLTFENGRLASGDGDIIPVVQFKGSGGVLLETLGEPLTLQVQAQRGFTVRREVVLGWFGRLVPRALPPSDASHGQHGLVSFAGEGRVLIASG
jgi:uncharacterized protein (AIM24 family)